MLVIHFIELLGDMWRNRIPKPYFGMLVSPGPQNYFRVLEQRALPSEPSGTLLRTISRYTILENSLYVILVTEQGGVQEQDCRERGVIIERRGTRESSRTREFRN